MNAMNEAEVNAPSVPDLLIGTHLLGHTLADVDGVDDVLLPLNFSITGQNGSTYFGEEVASNPFEELNIPYALVETIVAVLAVVGNAAVIIVFQQEKRLHRKTNYYIVSLAFADFLVGLFGVPFAILASVGLPRNLHACLGTITLLVVLCTISIFCLVGVSIDRYWAILHPIKYSRNVSTRTAIKIISLCWIAGSFIGFLPLLGWNAAASTGDQPCLFVEVMDYSYLVFLYFVTIITPAVMLAGFYAHIYTVIIRQMKEVVTIHKPDPKDPNKKTQVVQQIRRERGGTMLRALGAAQKREVKATQNLSIIVLFFMICWVPLYTINCINAFCNKCLNDPMLTYFCIILSHLNSALNPILYAYHLRDFRKALKTSMMRLCGMKVPPEPEQVYKISLINQKREQLERRTQSHPKIFCNSNLSVASARSKDSPSPRARHSTKHRSNCSSIVNFTVDTHCKIWQSLDTETLAARRPSDETHVNSYLSTKLQIRNNNEDELKCLKENLHNDEKLKATFGGGFDATNYMVSQGVNNEDAVKCLLPVNNEIIVKITRATSDGSLKDES